MQNKQVVNVRGILVLAGVAVITAAVGFATTVQLSARNDQGAGQAQAEPGGRRGPGMMAQGMMGPGGPGMRGGRGGGPFGPFGAGLRGLDLTDAQREQVRAVMESHRDEQRAIGERMQAARRALHQAIAADVFDEGVIRAKAGELGAVEADAAVLQAKIHGEIFALLTPEQAAKAKEFRSRMEQRMKDGRGRGMRPQQGPRPEARPEPGSGGDIEFPETV